MQSDRVRRSPDFSSFSGRDGDVAHIGEGALDGIPIDFPDLETEILAWIDKCEWNFAITPELNVLRTFHGVPIWSAARIQVLNAVHDYFRYSGAIDKGAFPNQAKGILRGRKILPLRIRERLKDRIEHHRTQLLRYLPVNIGASQKPIRVLFPEFYPHHVNLIAPIARALQQRKEVNLMLASYRPPVSRALTLSGLTSVPLYRCFHHQIKRTLEARRKMIGMLVERMRSDTVLQAAFGSDQNNIWLEAPGLIEETVIEADAAVATVVELLTYVIEKFAPTVIMLPTDRTVQGRAAAFLARARGIPSLCIQHGLVADNPREFPPVADVFAFWGEGSRDLYLRNGVEPHRLKVTGAPRYDALKAKLNGLGGGASVVRKNGSRPVVLYAAQIPGTEISMDEQSLLFRTLIEGFRGYKAARLAIKLHPGDHPSRYADLLSTLDSSHVEIQHHPDIIDSILGSDLMVTMFSTTGIEAMALGRPVITVNFSGAPDRATYATEGAAISVRSPEELMVNIDRVLGDKNLSEPLIARGRRYAERWLGQVDGKASERIADLIEQVSRGSSKVLHQSRHFLPVNIAIDEADSVVSRGE